MRSVATISRLRYRTSACWKTPYSAAGSAAFACRLNASTVAFRSAARRSASVSGALGAAAPAAAGGGAPAPRRMGGACVKAGALGAAAAGTSVLVCCESLALASATRPGPSLKKRASESEVSAN